MPTLEVRALAALDAYLDLAPGPRAKALGLLRTSDPELHAQVVQLLEADALQGPLLRSPQEILSGYEETASERPGDAIADPRIGSLLGSWRVEEAIGSGGMGTVYRASRADGQYAHVVALKCVGTEVESPLLAEAIRNERSTLALLEHPNIATLLDGGIDGDGYPWFAMQLVQGEPIDRWCDGRRLGIRERIELLIRLCDGLAYAHGKDALHSDIKPSNILVDDAGRPVLLDFGLSSLTTLGGDAQRPQVAMTPGYTAPEVPSDGYSVRTDIYALGMVLYRLLCGALPSRGVAPGMALPAPRPPSQLALQAPAETSQARGLATPPALSRMLAGDLDMIAMTCVARDPDKRYASVNQLQADLRAWLQGRPVSPRRKDVGYRAWLFLRRNRVAVAVTACGLLALCLGVGWAYRMHLQSAQQAEITRSMRQLLDESLNIMAVTDIGPPPLLSNKMLQSAEEKLRKRSAGAMPEVRAYGLLALARSYAVAGDYKHAQGLVGEARTLGDADAGEAVLADAVLSHLLNLQARFPDALRVARQGLGRLDAVPEEDRATARLALEVELARGLRSTGQVQEGKSILDHALARAEAMSASDPKPLAELLILRGEWAELYYRLEEAGRDYQRAIALTSKDAPVIADNARAALTKNLLGMDQNERALQLATELLASRQRMFGEEHPETGKALVLLAKAAHLESTRKGAMVDTAKRGEAVLRAALGPEHPEVALAISTVDFLDRGSTRNSLDMAIDNARRMLQIMQRVHGPSTPNAISAMSVLAGRLAQRAEHQPGVKEAWQEPISLFSRALDMGRRQGMPMLSERRLLVRAKLKAGEVGDDLENEIRELISELSSARGPLNENVLEMRSARADLFTARKEPDRAKRELESLLGDLEKVKPTALTETIRANGHIALVLIAEGQGDKHSARIHLRQAYEIFQRLLGPEHHFVEELAVELAKLDPHKAASSGPRTQ